MPPAVPDTLLTAAKVQVAERWVGDNEIANGKARLGDRSSEDVQPVICVITVHEVGVRLCASECLSGVEEKRKRHRRGRAMACLSIFQTIKCPKMKSTWLAS